MGAGASRRPQPRIPIPQYGGVGAVPPQLNVARPSSPLSLSRRSNSPKPNQMIAMPPFQQGTPPRLGQSTSYLPPSPLLQRFSGQPSFQQQQQQHFPTGPGGFRDVDYTAVANIAGLNPGDVALLHREYVNLTRGGMQKIDRVCFRQLLRDAMVEANNEHIDRTIENIFICIDRNHDGFIDFPEFVGAFRDVLRGPSDPYNCMQQQQQQQPYHDDRSRIHSNIFSQPLAIMQQPQLGGQIITVPSTGIQQQPYVCNSAAPLVISVDSNQSPYIIQ